MTPNILLSRPSVGGRVGRWAAALAYKFSSSGFGLSSKGKILRVI